MRHTRRREVENEKQNTVARREGPRVGGEELRKSHAFSQFRTAVPIADRQSVHLMPVIAGWIPLEAWSSPRWTANLPIFCYTCYASLYASVERPKRLYAHPQCCFRPEQASAC